MLYHVASDFVELSKVTGQNNTKKFLADEMSSKNTSLCAKESMSNTLHKAPDEFHQLL